MLVPVVQYDCAPASNAWSRCLALPREVDPLRMPKFVAHKVQPAISPDGH